MKIIQHKPAYMVSCKNVYMPIKENHGMEGKSTYRKINEGI